MDSQDLRNNLPPSIPETLLIQNFSKTTQKMTFGASILPELPFTPLQHRLDTSSDELEGKRALGQEPKKLRSTSATPRDDFAKAWAPQWYGNFMNIDSVTSLSARDSDLERADQERKSVVDNLFRVLFWRWMRVRGALATQVSRR